MASIRENVAIGRESIIGRNAMVENNTRIGSKATIQTGCYITADMTIEDEVFIGPCCSTSNDKYMGKETTRIKVQLLKEERKSGITQHCCRRLSSGRAVIGAGAVITKDVPAGKTAVGNPGRLMK